MSGVEDMCQTIAIGHADEMPIESLPRVLFVDGDRVVEMQKSNIEC
jgi:hypothetical protein